MPRPRFDRLDTRPWRELVGLALALPWLLVACGGGSEGSPAPDAPDSLTAETTPDLVAEQAPADQLAKADVPADLPPDTAWELTPQPGDEPASDAWLRVVARDVDPDLGRLHLVVEAGELPDLFGLALGVSFDPALASVIEVRAPEALPEASGATWGVLWRQEPGRLVAGLALRRTDDPLFGDGSSPKVSLPAGTPLLEIDVQVESPGELVFGWLVAETLVLGADLALRPVEPVDLAVTVRKGGAR